METSLVHTRLNTFKIGLFIEMFFKRWQKSVFSIIDVVNMEHVLTNLKLKDNSEFLPRDTINIQVKHIISSTLTNELFDIYF